MRTHGGVSTILVTIALGTALPDASAGSHRVAPGDSLWVIARARGCDVETVRRANRLRGTRIRPGQKLRIPSCDGTSLRSGETRTTCSTSSHLWR